ncbi:chaperonin 10-like protein [Plectosphaerella plurivora]|uniref:Chaperonin 10-like protein n=1 Tax=Plectosphaerella plurivora TaxID=936078 RepID=A0A9P9AB06_9PEZI|nr:chaperonin 10-like protein [Plectosphaerella plurivora]
MSYRAWQISKPGQITSGNLAITTLPIPSEADLGKTDVLVQVVAASVNPNDYQIVEMTSAAANLVKYPRTPGFDYSGRVIAVGRKVTDVKPGDLVFGRTDPVKLGGLAEYVVAPIDGLAIVPHGLPLQLAGAYGNAALTAYQSIKPYVRAGDKIFLNGGSGGVGTMAIQIAKVLGCHVTVSCSTEKIQLVRSLGADDVIDYRVSDVIKELLNRGKVFSLIVDLVGGSPENLFLSCRDLLLDKPKGHYVHVGSGMNMGAAAGMLVGLFLPRFLGGSKHKHETHQTRNSREDLDQVAHWMGKGELRVITDSVYEFEDVPLAFAKLKTHRTAGKIIINVRPGDGVDKGKE